jgi:hypothetical protein
METRKGKVTELHEKHDGWYFEVEVLASGWAIKDAQIVLPGKESTIDLLFSGVGNAEYEESHLLSQWVKEKPPFKVGGDVTVRFT